jgi:hypothetical protein
MNFTITIMRDEDGLYIAECPAIPGCVSQGRRRRKRKLMCRRQSSSVLQCVLKGGCL